MNMNIKAGILSAFIATVALSLLMVLKAMMGVMPELNAVAMLANMMNAPMIVGWIAHFMIGTIIWGLLFTFLVNKLPGCILLRALIFSNMAWLMMMLLVMPMVGAGLFGLKLGIMAPIATLMLHLIWGLVLGFSYKQLSR